MTKKFTFLSLNYEPPIDTVVTVTRIGVPEKNYPNRGFIVSANDDFWAVIAPYTLARQATSEGDRFKVLRYCSGSENERLVIVEKVVGGAMLKGIIEDLRGYLKENREIVYTIALVLLIDQFVFEGAFRERLKALVAGFLRKAETKAGIIDTTGTVV